MSFGFFPTQQEHYKVTQIRRFRKAPSKPFSAAARIYQPRSTDDVFSRWMPKMKLTKPKALIQDHSDEETEKEMKYLAQNYPIGLLEKGRDGSFYHEPLFSYKESKRKMAKVKVNTRLQSILTKKPSSGVVKRLKKARKESKPSSRFTGRKVPILNQKPKYNIRVPTQISARKEEYIPPLIHRRDLARCQRNIQKRKKKEIQFLDQEVHRIISQETRNGDSNNPLHSPNQTFHHGPSNTNMTRSVSPLGKWSYSEQPIPEKAIPDTDQSSPRAIIIHTPPPLSPSFKRSSMPDSSVYSNADRKSIQRIRKKYAQNRRLSVPSIKNSLSVPLTANDE